MRAAVLFYLTMMIFAGVEKGMSASVPWCFCQNGLRKKIRTFFTPFLLPRRSQY